MPIFSRKPLSRCIALTTFWSAALLAPEGLAVGLGDIALESHLGKPLRARIALTHLGDLSGDQIKVALGSEEDYTRLGVDREYLHSLIRMEPVVEDGRAFVRLTTSQPVVEPYINFVVSLRWPNGQLAREYTLLLDIPPVAAPAASSPATAATPVGNISAAAAAADAAPRAYQPASTIRPVAPSAAAPAPAAPVDGRYRTERGDSLWRLAQRLRPAGVSVEQMMAAIHAANPDAFLGGDPSRLKEAVTIAVPDAGQIAAAGPLPATAPASAPAAPASSAPAADRFAGSGLTNAPAESPAAAGEGGPRLELLAPSEVEQLSAENAALREEVKSLVGNVSALTGQLERSEERLRLLESQLQQVLAGYDRQRGIDGTATGGSPFGGGAAQPVAEVAADGGIAAAQPAPEQGGSLWIHLGYWIALGGLGGWALYQQSRGRRAEAASALEPMSRPAPLREGAPDVSGAMSGATPREPIASAPADAPVVAAPRPAPAVEPLAQWGSSEAQASYWQQRNDSAEELPLDLIDELPELPAASPAAAADAARPPTRADVAEESVDASISAGVFLAFGRYNEAEQVLREALQRDPSRHDLQLQLLDVYQQSDNREAFEQLAKAIEAECADQPDVVAEVAALRDSYSGRF
jgi:pilus assembly protein FimV